MPESKKQRPRTYDKSPEGIAYRRRYAEEHYERISLYILPELNDRITQYTQETGISKNKLATDAITEYLDAKQKDG